MPQIRYYKPMKADSKTKKCAKRIKAERRKKAEDERKRIARLTTLRGR